MVNRGGIEWDDPGRSLLVDLFIFEFFRDGYIFYNGLDQKGYKASWN
jgi:hypothetical protein